MRNLLVLFLYACGTQEQSSIAASDGTTVQGALTADTVKVRAIEANGAKVTEVDSKGTFKVTLPKGKQHFVIQGLNAQGQVVASVIVEASGTAGESVKTPPMSAETHAEARVYQETIAQGEDVDTVDLRSRVDAKLSASLDSDARVQAVGTAVIVAQRAKIKAMARYGVMTTQQAMFDAELSAALELNAALEAATSTSVYDDFWAKLDASVDAMGLHVKERARVEAEAGAAFRATLKAKLNADAAAEAGILAAAWLEARALALAIEASVADAPQAAKDKASGAAAQLRANVKAATSTQAAADAFVAFSASMNDTSSGFVALYLQLDVVSKVAVDGMVAAVATARAALNAALAFAADVELFAKAVVEAHADFQAAAQAQLGAMAGFGAKGQVTIDIMVLVNGSFTGT